MTTSLDTVWKALEYFKYTYSTILLCFCVVLVMSCIFMGQSVAAKYNIPPGVVFTLFWVLILWLGLMEGGQGCIVGLKPIPSEKYQLSHKKSYDICKVAHEGKNLERFIVGRQFLVVLVIFLINMMGEALPGANPLNLPGLVNAIFLENSLAMILTTIDIGQLPAQVIAAVSMLDFIHNYMMLATTYISLGIEASGILHCTYLVRYTFSAVAGNEEPNYNGASTRTTAQKVFFWSRVLLSLGILGFALAVTIEALLTGKSGMWEGVSPALSLVMFFLLLCIVGLMEGMQIAAFSLLNISDDELKQHRIAYENCILMFDGNNLQSFLIGRQIFVAALMFIVARIATISIDKDAGETNIFNVPDGLQGFLDTGLIGAVILTIIGSLVWRVIASSYPVVFLSNPIVYIIIRACLLLEATGICSAAWLIALGVKHVFGWKNDHEHLEENASTDESSTARGSEERKDMGNFALQMSTVRIKSVVFSSRQLGINSAEDTMEIKMAKMRHSFVASARLSSIVSRRDFGFLMKEIKGGYEVSDEEEVP